MKAIRIHGFDAAPVLEEMPDPVQRPGRTIVRMQAATVGHIDRTVWRGSFLRHPPLPYTPGVEAAGIVVASGRYTAGQRVWLRGSGLGTLFDGTWCEQIDAPDEALGPLPDALPMTLGAAFFSPTTSAWVALHQVAKLQAGERVLVTGASGAVGSLAVQLAREFGCTVAAVDPQAEAPANASADLLIDTVGGSVLSSVLPAVRPGGRAVLIGYTAGPTLQLDIAHFLQCDVALLPLNMFRREAEGRAAVPGLLERLADGRLHLDVHSFAFADAAMALDWIAQRGHRGRAVLIP
ncbi:alcohol dehydrogenase [Variovorax sp. Root318D1]|uniref:quinone oxidoreductase family protein n=1 Tax=Variovorax sp. Root318D1 TaxID=1736513 RepID=UPI0006F3CBB0|nr:zinc-binding alcohol dehydrogenase family protein [Variovorax sp. Root318D1]KQU88417.1 alcohol dehydrogenase [Variovorax sp. Root318D1]